jgi:hypothetical protein
MLQVFRFFQQRGQHVLLLRDHVFQGADGFLFCRFRPSYGQPWFIDCPYLFGLGRFFFFIFWLFGLSFYRLRRVIPEMNRGVRFFLKRLF